MTRIWRYDPEALDEAIDAAAYYDDQRPGLGGEFYGTLERTLDQLAEAPEHATRHPEAPPELGLVRFRMPRFPYVVVLYVGPTENRVVAVSHVRREPLYWLARAQRR